MIGKVRVYRVHNMSGDTIRFDQYRHLLSDRIIPARPVKTKSDFYRRFYAGEFGNHGPMWSSLDSWRESGYDDPITIRTLTQGGRCDYNIPASEVESRTKEFLREGWSRLNWSAMAPTEKTVLQGELQQGSPGVELFVSRELLPMRQALSVGGRRVNGVRGMQLLRWACDPSSFEHLMELLEIYPEHVIEFSCYSCPWGVIPGRNTVIWECRAY